MVGGVVRARGETVELEHEGTSEQQSRKSWQLELHEHVGGFPIQEFPVQQPVIPAALQVPTR